MNRRIRHWGFDVPVWALLLFWGSGALFSLAMVDSTGTRIGIFVLVWQWVRFARKCGERNERARGAPNAHGTAAKGRARREGDPTLGGDPERANCRGGPAGNVHIMLDA